MKHRLNAARVIAETVERSDPLSPLLWRDLVIIVDDGRQSAPAYEAFIPLARALKLDYPDGYGLLIIIPRNARPPSDQTRKAINDTFAMSEDGLKAVCWLVEGKGFQAAMVRAVLTGLRLLPRVAFESAVKGEMDDALAWLLGCLRTGAVVQDEVVAARESIKLRRK